MSESAPLSGWVVALSVSESEDLDRLGFAETHLRITLGEIARGLLLAGASILYGGRIDPDGYTDFLRGEIERYGRQNGEFLVCLPWPVHRAMSVEELRAARGDLGAYGKLICLGPDGTEVSWKDRGPDGETVSAEEARDSLSAARKTMASMAAVRILAGGKRQGYSGHLPGVLEEAILSIEDRDPIYLAGGFGGVSADLAERLGLDPDDALPDLCGEAPGEIADIAARAEAAGWSTELNGLSTEENRRLAVSHRPGEVASLVMTGLGRLAAGRNGEVSDG